MEMMKHLIDFMKNQGISELSTKQVIGDFNVYVTIEPVEEEEEIEYEEGDS